MRKFLEKIRCSFTLASGAGSFWAKTMGCILVGTNSAHGGEVLPINGADMTKNDIFLKSLSMNQKFGLFLLSTLVLIFFLWISPYLICRKMHQHLPNLSKKELWWPVFRGTTFFALFFTQFFDAQEFFLAIDSAKLPLKKTIVPIDSIYDLILFTIVSIISMITSILIRYVILRWALSVAFLKNNWQSRDISYDQFQKSIWSANIYGVFAEFLIVILLFMAILAVTFSLATIFSFIL